METSQELFQLRETSRQVSTSSSKRSSVNKSCSITQSIRSSRWREKFPEPLVKDPRRSRNVFRTKLSQPNRSLTNKRSNLICLSSPTNSSLTRRETSRELSKRSEPREAFLRLKSRSSNLKMRWLPTIWRLSKEERKRPLFNTTARSWTSRS